jgi:hypothetical protein
VRKKFEALPKEKQTGNFNFFTAKRLAVAFAFGDKHR